MSAKIKYNTKEFKKNNFANHINFLENSSAEDENYNLIAIENINPIKTEEQQFDVTVKKHAESIFIFADLCGIEKENINVSLIGNELVISANRVLPEETPKNMDNNLIAIQLNEIKTGDINKTIKIDEFIDKKNIKTSYQNGLLSLKIPIIKEKENLKINIE